jgi:hypothetical protein
MSDIDKAIDAAVIVLCEELRQIIKKKRTKREKCRNWIARRQTHGASKTLLRELANEDPQEYRRQFSSRRRTVRTCLCNAQ